MNKIANALNPFNLDFFIYIDAGSFRKKIYSNWPNEEFIEILKFKLKDRILFGSINPYNEISYSPNKDCIEGTIFAGSKIALKNLYDRFYQIHDERLNKGLFIGKEQIIYNIIAFEKNKNLTIKLKTYKN